MPKGCIKNISSKASPWKRRLASRMSRHKSWPEKLLWSRLKDGKVGVNFYAQRIMLGYIADFYCPKARLVVEVDGRCHAARRAYDAHRDLVLKLKGILTMRFTAAEVMNNLPAVVAIITDKARRRMA